MTQPNPKPNDCPYIADLVIEDMKERAKLGQKRYGVKLQPYNGRDPLQDAYEEALDLCQYLRSEIYQRDNHEK